jgi:hypothetical protein
MRATGRLNYAPRQSLSMASEYSLDGYAFRTLLGLLG